eukprot:3612486-Amphidinium_carterae.1
MLSWALVPLRMPVGKPTDRMVEALTNPRKFGRTSCGKQIDGTVIVQARPPFDLAWTCKRCFGA